MEGTFNIDKDQHYKSSRNPNFRRPIYDDDGKKKMHGLAIKVMNLISLFNSSSNENNNNISATNVLSKIKSVKDSEINNNEFDDGNNYLNYVYQIGGNLDKGISQTMISNNNKYPGKSILDKYQYYCNQLKGERVLEETAGQNFDIDNNNNIINNNLDNDNIDNNNIDRNNISNNQINNRNNIKKTVYIDNNDFNDNFDDNNINYNNNNNINPLQGKLREKYNNNNYSNKSNINYNNNYNYNNRNNNSNNNSNNQTIVQFNDYILRNNNSNKYGANRNIINNNNIEY